MSLYTPSESLVLKLTEWAVRCAESDTDGSMIERMQSTVDRRRKSKPVKRNRRRVVSLVHLASRFIQLEEDNDGPKHSA